MKRIFTLIICIVAFGNLGSAQQPDCTGGRYSTYGLFADVDVTEAVTFGNNISVGGSAIDLKMDVYEPSGDTLTDRPVVVLAFGGSFIGGDRSNVAFLCNIFAKMGYVAIAPDYRVGFFFPNQVTTTLAVFRSAHDIKAAVRYLKKTAAEDGNPYGIDPDRIIVGGISAGAIGAIHAAYLDSLNEVPAYMVNDTAGLGGVEGNSGTLGYSSRPLAVLSFSGTIGDTSWIEQADMPICSIHEEDDATVPYGTQEINASGFPTGLIASGSRDIHVRARNLDIDNSLMTYWNNADHVGYFSPVDQQALDFATTFCANMVCNGSSDLEDLDIGEPDTSSTTTGIGEMTRNNRIDLFPNPAKELLNFNMEENGLITIVDIAGREIMRFSGKRNLNRVDVSALTPGTYVVRSVGRETRTGYFVKE